MTSRFAVFYEAGMCGTWLAWFVNMHKNFPAAELNPEYYWNDGVLSDYSSTGSNWTTHLDHENEPTYNSDVHLNLEDQLQAHRDHGTRVSRPDAPKWCVKLLPDHAMCMCPREKLYEVLDQIDAAIVPYAENDFVKPLARRYEYLRPDWFQAPEYSHELRIHDIRREAFLERLNDQGKVYKIVSNHVPYLPIDIGKLYCYNDEEYKKLVDFIDEEPLDNWKELVADTTVELYKRFM